MQKPIVIGVGERSRVVPPPPEPSDAASPRIDSGDETGTETVYSSSTNREPHPSAGRNGCGDEGLTYSNGASSNHDGSSGGTCAAFVATHATLRDHGDACDLSSYSLPMTLGDEMSVTPQKEMQDILLATLNQHFKSKVELQRDREIEFEAIQLMINETRRQLIDEIRRHTCDIRETFRQELKRMNRQSLPEPYVPPSSLELTLATPVGFRMGGPVAKEIRAQVKEAVCEAFESLPMRCVGGFDDWEAVAGPGSTPSATPRDTPRDDGGDTPRLPETPRSHEGDRNVSSAMGSSPSSGLSRSRRRSNRQPRVVRAQRASVAAQREVGSQDALPRTGREAEDTICTPRDVALAVDGDNSTEHRDTVVSVTPFSPRIGRTSLPPPSEETATVRFSPVLEDQFAEPPMPPSTREVHSCAAIMQEMPSGLSLPVPSMLQETTKKQSSPTVGSSLLCGFGKEKKRMQRFGAKNRVHGWGRIFKSMHYEQLVGFFVIVNTALVGWETNELAVHQTRKLSFEIETFKVMFALCFLIELIAKLTVFGSTEFFRRDKQRAWNCFDSVMAVGGLIEVMVSSHAFFSIRPVMLLRLLRPMSSIPELKTLVRVTTNSFTSFLWTLLLLFLLIFVAALLFTQIAMSLVQRGIVPASDIQETWGSVWVSIESLFKAVLGGDDWSVLLRPLAAGTGVAGTVTTVLFMVYVAFASVVVLSLVVGVVVDSTHRLINSERDEDFIQHAHQIFGGGDVDGDMEINQAMFREFFGTAKMNDYLATCDFDRKAAFGLLRMLDSDQNGTLSVDQLTRGCLNLRGQARTLDIMQLTVVVMEAQRQNALVINDLQKKIASVHSVTNTLSNRTNLLTSNPERQPSSRV
eukprot:TRINITY_DN61426_c0_g1_i1.p1 TRINITY_DN61426_c0_g1~~TRINITY_DN61426_c0_g1_i1.p1  ORF type:complete len:863 (-),score=123.70 TRINITY_DN61426_c0_g1_i1:178-2766(-)